MAAPTFTYQYGQNPRIDYPRLLIGDTAELDEDGERAYVFADEEIAAAYIIVGKVYQSGMLYSGSAGRSSLPVSSVSYYRVAAMLLEAAAGQQSQLAGITKLLDVSIDPGKTAAACRAQAQSWRTQDDESGAFAIIEQVTTPFSFFDRVRAEWQRSIA
jgi:hypothetical protein